LDYQQQEVAQMTFRILVLTTIVSVTPAISWAQSEAQTAASQAEAAGRWDDAIRLHHAAIAADPHRADLWVRVADIEATRGNIAGSVSALEQAVAVSRDSAALFARLSQAYASAGSGPAALHAIDGALALKPGDAEYLRARATLATWVADYRAAQESYRQLEVLHPGDLALALAFARVSAWAGDTDQAVKQYKRYLRAADSNPTVWLELAKAETWRGNYAGAIAALDSYSDRGGETQTYEAALAAVFANSGQPARAESLLTPLLAQSPDNYELNLTRVIALARQRRAREAFESLDTVRRLSPEGPQTRTAERMLHTLLSSSAEAPFTSYADSDDLQVQRIAPRATIALNSGTQLAAGYERSRLDARSGSGLDALDGSSVAQYEHTWAGAEQRVGPLTIGGQAGYATAGTHTSTTYGVRLDARLADTAFLTLSRTSAPFVVSPRTVDLGLTATSQRAQLEWSPALQYHVAFDASWQELSDGNHRWEVTVSPRRTMARRARFNLDLGASVYRLQTTQDLDHGYYDPQLYEYYAATVYPYFKVRENVGLAMTIAMGGQRDNTSRPFHLGGNVSGEATFGIYRPWVLKVNGSATLNGRLDSGAFRGFGAGAALVRRF
jgi:predicted Zn-dependent protease